MTLSPDSTKTMDAYLTTLRKRLRQLNESEVNEIVQEIHSHILDKASQQGVPTRATIDAAITALGTPEELAGSYVTNAVLQRAQATPSPLLILRALFRWAGLSVAGFVTFIVSVTGYCVGASLLLCAVLKPFFPQKVGLWFNTDSTDPDSFRLHLGFTPTAGVGHEYLGGWIIPIGLVLGAIFLFLTYRFGQWSIRKFWRPQVRYAD
ncbi:MAG TPA: DUF1700 domain-containing protein [Acidobacteriaceae bacterium]